MNKTRSEYHKQYYQNRKTNLEWLAVRRIKNREYWRKLKVENPQAYQEKLKQDSERIRAARHAAKIIVNENK